MPLPTADFPEVSGEIRLMEVCGTHTMSIARNGIRSLLPDNVRLISGPGCPVCVTCAEDIDAVLALSMRPEVIIASYGDMLRVPGSIPGDSLMRRSALGADVRTVYSPVDAIEIAKSVPDRNVVFLGVGFETTAPGTAVSIRIAAEENVRNYSVFSMLKSVEPALRALIGSDGFNIQGFLCPGHVASITGARGFSFLAEEYQLPSVIAGFEPEEIVLAVSRLLHQIAEGRSELENAYPKAVSSDGNVFAQSAMADCFELRDEKWRGLGFIPLSGFGIRSEYAEYDAERRFDIEKKDRIAEGTKVDALVGLCRCGDIITGRAEPRQCPLFGKRCLPEDPVGPCMVSGEGACAAAYRYLGFDS